MLTIGRSLHPAVAGILDVAVVLHSLAVVVCSDSGSAEHKLLAEAY